VGVHPGEVGLIGRTGRRPNLDNAVPAGTLEQLQERIGIAFRDPALLQEALTHSSFANESPHLSPRDNERLEYLGDAVLQLITADYLFRLRPQAHEGEMTQVRSAMVNTNTLAMLGENLGLGEFLYLGKGIAKGGGRSLKSLLANGFEAVLGAVFLDAGFDAAYHHYLAQFRALPEPLQDENHKGRLQRVVQDRFNRAPVYDSAGSGVGRHREYTAVVYAGSESLGTGHGATKQAAEQDAALAALAGLEGRSRTGLPGAQATAASVPSLDDVRSGSGTPRRGTRGGRRRADAAEAPESGDSGPGAPGAVPGEPPFVAVGAEVAAAKTEDPVPGEPPFSPVSGQPRRRARGGRRRSGRSAGGDPGVGPEVAGGSSAPAAQPDAAPLLEPAPVRPAEPFGSAAASVAAAGTLPAGRSGTASWGAAAAVEPPSLTPDSATVANPAVRRRSQRAGRTKPAVTPPAAPDPALPDRPELPPAEVGAGADRVTRGVQAPTRRRRAVAGAEGATGAPVAVPGGSGPAAAGPAARRAPSRQRSPKPLRQAELPAGLKQGAEP